ncbi:MAG TPA: hypothetical protein VFN55_12805 [Solirubrobacteraceae bacterium]|nr:hypothetical protein [Solirubrobacteraceae bacterium]
MDTVARIVIGLAGAVGVLVVLASAVRSVVLPKAVPARLARVAFLAVQIPLTRIAAGHTRRGRWDSRENLLSLQGPLGILAQLVVWAALVAVGFTAVLWAVEMLPFAWTGVRDAASQSGSSLTTLGIVRPHNAAGDFIAFTEAGIGLVLLALVVTYLPTIYHAFAQREAAVAKLAVRAGVPPTATGLLRRSWELARFDRLEEVWNAWEDWFIDLGESHTSFPQLIFFRSHRPHTSWVTSAAAVLDAAALARTSLEREVDSRSALTLAAGRSAFELIGAFMGIAPTEAEIKLPREVFERGLDELAGIGVPVAVDRDAAWEAFATERRRYEPLLFVLAGMVEATPTDWLPQELFDTHRPPVINPHRAARAINGDLEGAPALADDQADAPVIDDDQEDAPVVDDDHDVPTGTGA